MTQFTITIQYLEGSERMGLFISSDPPLAECPELERCVRANLKNLIAPSSNPFMLWLLDKLVHPSTKPIQQMIDLIIQETKVSQSANAPQFPPSDTTEQSGKEKGGN